MRADRTAMRGACYVAVALVAAILCAAAFPPLRLWSLAWVGLAPLLVVLRRLDSDRAAAGLALVWLTAFAWGVGSWLPGAVSAYFGAPTFAGVLVFFAVAWTMAGIEYALFALAWRRFAALSDVVAPLAAGAAWVAADLARVYLLTGCPWGLLGYSQVESPATIRIADVTGVYGVTFTLVAVNAALAEVWLRWRWRPALGPAAVVLAVLAYGVTPIREGEFREPTAVAVVQADVAPTAQWSPEHYGAHLAEHLDLTRTALDAPDVRLVVWPESALTFFLETEPAHRRAIAAVLGPRDGMLVAGGPSDPHGDARYRNSAFLVGADGDVVARYDKRRLLPFTEYLPGGERASWNARFGRVRRFVPGDVSAPLPTPAGRAGVLVCNEVFYGDEARRQVEDGAQLLIALANDGWVDHPQFGAMALDMLRLRAVEQRRWAIRASGTGPSGFVDPSGRVRSMLPPNIAGLDVVAIRRHDERSPYGRGGDLFALACLAATPLLLAATRRRRATPVARRLTPIDVSS